MSIPVFDLLGAARDPALPTLAVALDPATVQREFGQRLRPITGKSLALTAIRVARYKPGRRCVIEYELDQPSEGQPETVTWIGKVRRARFGKSAHRLAVTLWNAGFSDRSEDAISVPEPIGHIPAFEMWLQRKMPGRPATELLAGPGRLDLARHIAEAAHKLHQAQVPIEQRHTMADELRILHEHLPQVARSKAEWQGRIEGLLQAAERLGNRYRVADMKGIHRDFYSDQVIVDGERLYLIDFDLYAEGDPSLDIGNFIGHVTEQALRTLGSPEALADVEQALVERFLELSGASRRQVVEAYAALTLVRHVYLSTLFPERQATTEVLLALCEERLNALAPRLRRCAAH